MAIRVGLSDSARACFSQRSRCSPNFGSSLTAIRYIAARTFYNSGGCWYQGDYDASKHEKSVKVVKIGTDEYTQLLNDNPRMAKYMVFDSAVCNVSGQWYRVTR